jgi:GMP synthase (glutamine-hydrolysing)
MTTKQRSALVILHVAFEDLGSFESVLVESGYELKYVKAGTDKLSDSEAVDADLLIVMGGPISANDVDDYPFLQQEIDLLRIRMSMNKATLGVCLGAQLIARAAGAAVYSGKQKEIGWFPVSLTEAGAVSALRYLGGEDAAVLHWHGETFDLPDNAVHLASSELYTNQAFSIGNTLALQFHPEVTAKGLEQWFIGHTGEISQTEGISVSQLRADTQRCAAGLKSRAQTFMRDWLRQTSP